MRPRKFKETKQCVHLHRFEKHMVKSGDLPSIGTLNN